MKQFDKIKLLSSLGTLLATTSLAVTSCAITRHSDGTTNDQIDIANISWITRAFYEYKDPDNAEEEIANRFTIDNMSVFSRYEGLQDVINVLVTADPTVSSAVRIDIELKASSSTYKGEVHIDSECEQKKEKPTGGKLTIDTSSVDACLTTMAQTKYTLPVKDPSGADANLVAENCTITGGSENVIIVQKGTVSTGSIEIKFTPTQDITGYGAIMVTIRVMDDKDRIGVETLTVYYKDTETEYPKLYLHKLYATATISSKSCFLNISIITTYDDSMASTLKNWLWYHSYTFENKWYMCSGYSTPDSGSPYDGHVFTGVSYNASDNKLYVRYSTGAGSGNSDCFDESSFTDTVLEI
ncbi:MAG: hypothetical protein HUJ52_00355 [Malacoplasma sp.]|nr:hypothetical protein [Malacoplasma sp.]